MSNKQLPHEIVFNQKLGKLRTIFWPIYNQELPKFFTLALMMFCALFNQNILRILKDSIVIPTLGAEITSFAKVYCITPAAGIFVIIYAKMVNNFKFSQIYYILLTFFLSYFTIFAFIIYPYSEFFHIDKEIVSNYQQLYPHLKWFIAIIGNWGCILFYVLSELWPNIFYILLFWQFANELTGTEQAKRFYTLLSLFGNSSLIFAGLVIINLSSANSFLQNYFSTTENSIILVQFSIMLVIIMGIIAGFTVRYLTKSVKTDPSFARINSKPKKNRYKLGLVDSFKYIIESKYLWFMLIASASYGFTINLVEAVWKAKISELYPTVTSYASFNSLYIIWTGITIMIMNIIGNNLMRVYGWFVVAVITPIIILVTGSLFFILIVFDKFMLNFVDGVIITSPLAAAVFIGTIQNILSKGSKYSIWDTSREMLYIPLDEELRTKGKAAVDVVSSKIGKSSSGLIQSILFTIFPAATFSSISPIMMIVFIIICVIWLVAVGRLSEEYKKLV